MSDPVWSVRGLNFGFPERRLFVDWSADFLPGVTWLVGGDGSGKTSLLRLMAGEWPTGSAEFRLDGIRLPVDKGRPRSEVAWCGPQTDAFDAITPLAWFDRLRAERPHFDAGRLRDHLDGFGLGPHLAKPLYQLSTGSRRKVFMAGSLAANAPVTLLDQPAAALDEASRRHLMRTLTRCAADPGRRVWLVADHRLPDDGAAVFRVLKLGP